MTYLWDAVPYVIAFAATAGFIALAGWLMYRRPDKGVHANGQRRLAGAALELAQRRESVQLDEDTASWEQIAAELHKDPLWKRIAAELPERTLALAPQPRLQVVAAVHWHGPDCGPACFAREIARNLDRVPLAA
jgi:hypothetical protein